MCLFSVLILFFLLGSTLFGGGCLLVLGFIYIVLVFLTTIMRIAKEQVHQILSIFSSLFIKD